MYGSFHPPGRYSMQSQYSIDGQKPFVFLPGQEVPTAIHQTQFYSSPQFLYGQHTLVITNLGEQLFLDFFDVFDGNEPTTSRSNIPFPATNQTTTTPLPKSEMGTSTTNQTTASSSNHYLPVSITTSRTSMHTTRLSVTIPATPSSTSRGSAC